MKSNAVRIICAFVICFGLRAVDNPEVYSAHTKPSGILDVEELLSAYQDDHTGWVFIPPGDAGRVRYIVTNTRDYDYNETRNQQVEDSITGEDSFIWSADSGTVEQVAGSPHMGLYKGTAQTGSSVQIKVTLDDDGRYAEDELKEITDLIYPYKLTGAELVPIGIGFDHPDNRQSLFTNGTATLRATVEHDLVPNRHPRLLYELYLDGDLVDSYGPTLSELHDFEVTVAGSYTLKIINYASTPESAESEAWKLFQIEIIEPTITFDWDGHEESFINKINEIKLKQSAAQQVANDIKSLIDEYQSAEVASAIAAADAQINLDIEAANQTLTQAISDAEAAINGFNSQKAALVAQETALNAERAVALAAGDFLEVAEIDAALIQIQDEIIEVIDDLIDANNLLDRVNGQKSAVTAWKAGYTEAKNGTMSGIKGLLEANDALHFGNFFDAGGVLLDVAGIALAVNDFATATQKLAILEEKLETFENLDEAVQQAVLNMTADRLEGPLESVITVKSTIGGIDFSFSGSPTWRAREEGFIQADYSHLTQLDYAVPNWDEEYVTDSSGDWSGVVSAGGNLGEEIVRLNTEDEDNVDSVTIKATGMSEEEMLAFASLRHAELNQDRIAMREQVNAGTAILEGILSAVALIAAIAAAPMTLLIVSVGAIVVAIASIFFNRWATNPDPLIDQIRELFPKNYTGE